MATFGQLRKAISQEIGAKEHMDLMVQNPAYREFHHELNAVEFERGYSSEYLDPGAPSLCDLELLPPAEFVLWMERFRRIRRQ